MAFPHGLEQIHIGKQPASAQPHGSVVLNLSGDKEQTSLCRKITTGYCVNTRVVFGNSLLDDKATQGGSPAAQFRPLRMFWQGVQGVDIISDVKKKSDFWSASNVGFLNKGTRLLNAWSPTNPNSTIPALTRSDTNNEQRVSTYFVENGSFLKLRNIQLGYTVPAVISKKLRMERLRFYCSAQNLLTIKSKDFTGEDPENPNFSYPIPVNITFGLNIGF